MTDLVKRLREIGAQYSACDRQQTIYEAADALEAAQTQDRTQHVANARIAEHRKAVEWLHSRAREMNDPHARLVLNSAAFDYGLARFRTEERGSHD